jgi:hypothetical protein
MRRDTLTTTALALGVLLGVGYIAAGLIGWAADASDDNSDLAAWLLLLVGGGAILLAGLFAVTRWSTASLALGTIGALAGALALFWTVIVPLLALVFIGLAIAVRRRGAGKGTT